MYMYIICNYMYMYSNVYVCVRLCARVCLRACLSVCELAGGQRYDLQPYPAEYEPKLRTKQKMSSRPVRPMINQKL